MLKQAYPQKNFDAIANRFRRTDHGEVKARRSSFAIQSASIEQDGAILRARAARPGAPAAPADESTPAAALGRRRNLAEKSWVSRLFSASPEPQIQGKKSGKPDIEAADLRAALPAIAAWSLYRGTGAREVTVATLRNAGMSRNAAYQAAELLGVGRDGNNGHIARLPSDTGMARLLGCSILTLRQLLAEDLTSAASIEAAVLRVFIAENPGKHAMRKLSGLIGRSKPTTRKRLALIEGLVVVANFVEMAVSSAAMLTWAAQMNSDGGVYWTVDWRHRWLPWKRMLLQGDIGGRFREMVAAGFEAVLIRQSVNSFELE